MADISYASVWRLHDPDLEAGVKAFWQDLKLLNVAERERRAGEVCQVAYADGKIIGVTTISLDVFPPLRCRLAFLRCAVSAEFRQHYLATYLTRNSLTVMENWALDNPGEKLQGVAFIIRADELGSKAVYPQWADWNTHYNLVAFSPQGEQLRLAWFRHARFDSPLGDIQP